MTRNPNARRIALALPLAALAAAAAAQTTNTSLPAPLPIPAAPVIVLPPTATPTPRATTSPTLRATPRARPTQRPTARPTPAASPSPAPAVTATPAATPSPAPVARSTPAPTATPRAAPTPAASLGATSELARTPGEEARVEKSRWWPGVVAALALLVGGALGIRSALVRRRERLAREEAERRPQVTVAGVAPAEPASGGVDVPTFWTPSRPVPPDPPPADAPAESAPAPAPTSPRIAVTLRPRRAGLNLVSATADVEVTVRNDGDAPAEEVAVAVRLLAGRAGQDGELGALFGGEQPRPVTPPFALAPGEERVCRTTLVLPRAEIEPIPVDGRAMFVPVVALDIRHRRADGSQGQNAAAYVVGAVRAGGEKLSPFWLDAAPRMRDEVEARPHGLSLES